MAQNKDKNKDLAYYLTLFKLEGHETWRAHLGSDVGAFAREQANWTAKTAPVVTETRVLRFDRISGTFAEPK